MSTTNSRRFRRVLIKLTILAISTLICLLIAEVGVRVLLPFYNPNSLIPFGQNEEGIITGKPGTSIRRRTPKGDFNFLIAFNQLGFRDTKDTTTGTATNIYVAGDSFSIGWGVEEAERYSNVMEHQLGLPVYNIAIPEDIRGYIATVKYAEKHGAKIRHMVVGLCMENDIWDYSLAVSTHEMYAKAQNRGALRAVFNWFKEHSALWVFTSFQVQRNPAGRAFFEKIGVAKNVEALTHKNDYSEKMLTATRDELLKLTTNYDSVVLVIPSRGLWFGKNVEAEQKVHDGMIRLLQDAGVRLVDMRPVYEKSGQPLQYYFVTDPHWNSAGHKAAGEELSKYLRTLPSWSDALPVEAGR